MERALPKEIPTGFVAKSGVPNASSKPYFSTTAEAVSRCLKDPRCVGLSSQRLFFGELGTPTTVPGRSGETGCILRN